MGLFRRKPRCPACKEGDHIDVEYHVRRFGELEKLAQQLQRELQAAAYVRCDEAAAAVYQDALLETMDEAYFHGKLMCVLRIDKHLRLKHP